MTSRVWLPPRARYLLFSLVGSLTFFGFTAWPVTAAELCCVCAPKANANQKYCIRGGGSTCPDMQTSSKNPDMKDVVCQPATLSLQECTTKNLGGLCPVAPFSDADYKKTGSTSGTQTVITPQLNVAIPGLTFSNTLKEVNGNVVVPFLSQYVAGIYRWLIGISIIAAAIAIIWGGFMYIFGAATGKSSAGSKLIEQAVIGLVLVLATYTILNTVNPKLTSPESLAVTAVKRIPYQGDRDASPASLEGKTGAGKYALPKAICKSGNRKGEDDTLPKCEDLCNGCGPKNDLPFNPTMAKSSELVAIKKGPGLDGGGLVRPEAAQALLNAGEAAQKWEGGPYTLVVGSTYRDLAGQVLNACKKYCTNAGALVGVSVAVPGGSNHGSGIAVDVALRDKNGAPLIFGDSYATQKTDFKQANVDLLNAIMTSVGWVRYCSEAWHFEWGTDGLPSRSKTCTFNDLAK